MKNIALYYTAIAILLCGLSTLSATGCNRRDTTKKPVAETTEAAINEYSHESLLGEVLQQIQDSPKNSQAYYHLADLYERQGRYQQAIEAYQQVIRLDPDKEYTYFKLGTAYSRLDQPEKAVDVLLEAAKRLPNNPIVMNNLAIVYGKLGKLDEEVVALQKALELRPKYASARFNLAITLIKKNDLDGARAQYEVLNKIDRTMAQELKKRIDRVQ
ncbi:MAG: tetratricopeptide repeat protein [Proteobacteria bacterium]|nr:tetratricopeptide repeat protein [Pseudomonadota bacterium]MBU1686691.1 tetratricopeptide repeat protein [Pseudomonadota bacterium]